MNLKNVREFNIEKFNDIENTQSAIFEAEIDGMKEYISIYTTENNSFKLISVIEERELLEQVYGIKRRIIEFLSLCVLIVLIFAFIFSNQFLKPILIMKNHLTNISFGDLNGLKMVNDSYGHQVGDMFIKTFAAEFKKLGAEKDIMARFGGDEFIAVIYDRNRDSLTESMEKMIDKFKGNPLIFDGNRFICSFSYGISSSAEDGEDFNTLVKIADKRMYECKRNNEG